MRRPLDPPDPGALALTVASFVIECLLACAFALFCGASWLALDRLLGLLR